MGDREDMMRGRIRGVVATAALVLGVSMTGLLSSGTASASQPIVVGDCSTSVQGESGPPLSLAPAAVLQPVLNVVRAVPLVGPGLVGQVENPVNRLGSSPARRPPRAA